MAKKKLEPIGDDADERGTAQSAQRAQTQAVAEILERSRDLRQLASSNDLRMLAYLLDMVALEALETQGRIGAREPES